MRITSFVVFTAICYMLAGQISLAAESDFPVDDFLRPRIDFWKKVYTEISIDEWFLHDMDDLSIIYGSVSVDHTLSPRMRTRILNEKKKDVQGQLKKIILNKGQNLSPALAELFKKIEHVKNLDRLMYNIRTQQGMSDKFKRGIETSTKYLEKIENIIEREGLPREIMFLPHVESSFDYTAYSKVGAAGVWQFMRSTGRLYRLKQTYIIDERRDPMLATEAAIHLLKYNYSKVQSWPLAVTAYNFGLMGIERAVAATKTSSLSEIIKNYDGRRFGFASKNFYVSFIAAVEIAKNPEKYFKNLQMAPAIDFMQVALPKSLAMSQIGKVLELDMSTLREYNLSLRPIVFERDIALPANFGLKVPRMSKEVLIALDKKMSEAEEFKPISKKIFEPVIQKMENTSMVVPSAESAITQTKFDDYINSYNFNIVKVEQDLYKISVEIDETPGHYADWLVTQLATLSKLNGRSIRRINLGETILLPIKDEKISSFNKQRVEYHQSIIEDFFNNYRVAGSFDYKVRSGDSVSRIITKNDIPMWLLRSYMKTGVQLSAGEVIKIPVIEEISSKL